MMVGTFVAAFLGVTGLVYLNYPDKPAFPREFEGGLERELGGPGAVRVSYPALCRIDATRYANSFTIGTNERRR